MTGQPNPPDFLTDLAKEHWHELLPVLQEQGLNPSDLDTFAIYCQTFARWREAEEALDQKGTTTVARSGYEQVSPWITIAKNCRADLMKLGDRLGLNPSARTRIHASPTRDDSDDLLA